MSKIALYRVFIHQCDTFGIKMEFSTTEIGFEREQFFRLMDAWTLLLNGIYPEGEQYIMGFRDMYLNPATHLLSAFLRFEDCYDLVPRFDPNGQKAFFNASEFARFARSFLETASNLVDTRRTYAWV